jgi:SAM-dependent methyltransferase
MSNTAESTRGFAPTGTVDPLRYAGHQPEADESTGLLLAMIPHGARVLDVGCGTGSVSRLVRDLRGATVTGIEPQADRARAAEEAGLDVLAAPWSAETAATLRDFDIVLFADVLEHLTDPVVALELARGCLAPGGAIVASVPNVAHWTVRFDLLRGRFDYRDIGIMDATHLRWFTGASIERLFAAAGFRVERRAVSAGHWMWDYHFRPPWKWMSPSLRHRIVGRSARLWPELFGCQHVVIARPVSS